MHSVNHVRTMEVIDIDSGEKLGYIKDLKIDCDNYKVLSIIIPRGKMNWFGKSEDMEVPWSKIKKIGVDVILVEGFSSNTKEI